MTSRRKIIDDKLYVHFVTFSVNKKRRLFELDHPKRIFLGILNDELKSFTAKCIGFVIMPNHIHLLIQFSETNQLSSFIHALKRKSSFRIRNWYRGKASSYFEEINDLDHFWQPKCYSFEIESNEKLEEKLNYTHDNPVRTGLVERPEEWKWSSAGFYSLGKSVGVPIEYIS